MTTIEFTEAELRKIARVLDARDDVSTSILAKVTKDLRPQAVRCWHCFGHQATQQAYEDHLVDEHDYVRSSLKGEMDALTMAFRGFNRGTRY